MTKFPGGGLEYGEGTIECLHHETLEGLNQDIEIIEHFYTTDFFQQALFFDHTQQISIYNKAKLTHPSELKTSSVHHDYEKKDGAQSFRWTPLCNLSENDLSFPIDKYVLNLLKTNHK